MRDRIEKVQKEGLRKGEGESEREHRVRSMRGRIEDLKVLADINDPLVKKRFEDGLGTYMHSQRDRFPSIRN